MNQSHSTHLAKPTTTNLALAIAFVALGVAVCAAGIYVGETDDAPGAALLGLLVMLGAVAFAVRIARRKP